MKEKTLYEVLEVSENASTEVIEKAYKVLAKKYHPDLQEQGEKQNAENKMKQINEAYEILGNEQKRKDYDLKLQQERAREQANTHNQQQNNNQNFNYYNVNTNTQNTYSPNNPNNMRSDNQNYEQDRLNYERKLQREEEIQRKKMQENLNREYQNAYNDYLRSLGYRVKHKWTKENVKDFFIVILIMAIIITALWFIPPTHDWMVNFYEQNPILKTIIDIIIAIITGLFKGIWNFITGLFN